MAAKKNVTNKKNATAKTVGVRDLAAAKGKAVKGGASPCGDLETTGKRASPRV